MSTQKAMARMLLQKDYTLAENLTNDDNYMTFINYNGVMVYGVIVVDAEQNDYAKVYSRLREQMYIAIQRLRFERAFVTGVFVCKGENEQIKGFTTVNIEDYSNRIIEVRWLADTVQGKLKAYGSQPDKMNGLEKVVAEALSNQDSNANTNLDELLENEKENRLKSIKSKNINLTFIFIILNWLMLAITYATGGINVGNMVKMGAVEPELVFGAGQYYRLISSMFLHYGLVHILSNMLFLFVFGSSIERYYGKLKYFIIYIGSGIGAGLLFCAVSSGTAAGASGAVFGLIGAMLACSKKLKRAVDGKDSYFMLIFAVISICSGFLSDEVANSAHIGGFIFGLVSGWLLY